MARVLEACACLALVSYAVHAKCPTAQQDCENKKKE